MRQSGIAVGFATALLAFASPGAAQCNPSCQGDFNIDGGVTVEEIVTVVNNALSGCQESPEQEGCLASGGTVTTRTCCSTAPDFPDTCVLGPCSCAPSSSREVPFCECNLRTCFDRSARECISPP